MDDECSCVIMSGLLEWIDVKEDLEIGKLYSIINVNWMIFMKDINLMILIYICGMLLVVFFIFFVCLWKYGKCILYDSFRNIYDVVFKGIKSILVEEMMDLVRFNKEIGNLFFLFCLFMLVMFWLGFKLLGKVLL